MAKMTKMVIFFRLFLPATLVASTIYVVARVSTNYDYLWKRQHILNIEKSRSIGGKIKLTTKEKEVNKLILYEKNAELLKAHQNVSHFLPSRHFFHAKNDIEISKVFSIIKKIPKAASLHTHFQTSVSVDYIIKNITYRENIYGCFLDGNFKLRFLQKTTHGLGCKWKELKEYRNDDVNFDEWLKERLSLKVKNTTEEYTSIDAVWYKFQQIFSTIYDMLCYKPVFEDYLYQTLEELHADNVMYTEIRAQIFPLYELNDTLYDTKSFFNIFINTVEKFKEKHPGFLGVKYIHSINRSITLDNFKNQLDELIEIKNIFPNFVAGIDVVGYEEEGSRIVDFHEELLKTGVLFKYFFHAGETNWYGSTDLNLVDAILLNTLRIGHGFGLTKHPVLMELVKAQNISIEICPISNQVLMLNQDPRNHPAVSLIANGYPVVICNDDPSAWGATGLSYDWYIAFMAMTLENSGIEVLKQFAMDSITHSAMTDSEMVKALKQWNLDWEIFLNDTLN